MPSTQAIRRRIRSARNVAQITRALQLVASSRVRRAQENVTAARPYAEQLLELLARVASQADNQEVPLMARREIKRALVVLVTPDRGLAGALNSNTTRRGAQAAQELR